jgi:hexulose-6-phosphate isomerase
MEPRDPFRGAVFSRRDMLRYAALVGTSAAGVGLAGRAAATEPAPPAPAAPLARSPKRYEMKKSINLWAFPYPRLTSLKECFELAKRAGFDAVEVNYDLENDLSDKAGEKELRAIRDLAERAGIAISGICSFLFWPFPFSGNQEATRERAVELAGNMIRAARHLGVKNLLVVPGAVYIPWIKDSEHVPYKLCDERARAAVRRLLPLAEKHRVHLNIENIFFNAYLMSPADMIEFVDSFQSEWVHVHFDTGNIMPFQFPQDWIPLLGKRIKNVHFKEYSKKGTDFSLESFRPLLDGTTDWPAVIEALDAVGYRGYLTFEYFHPFQHYPEALVYQASDALDRMLGRG